MLLILGEEPGANDADSGAEEDRANKNQREACCNDEVAASEATIDTKDKTEGNGTTNESSVPDEEQLLVVEWVRVLRLVLAQFQKADQTNGRAKTAKHHDSQQDEDKGGREWHRAVREESQTEVAEDESLSEETQELEDDVRSSLTLR